MKITNKHDPNISLTRPKNDTTSNKTTFAEVMTQKQVQLDTEKLKALMSNIKEQGKQLVEQRTINNLMLYKKLIKEFLNYTVKNGFGMKESKHRNSRGRIQIHKMIIEVDEKLVQLTEVLLAEQADNLHMLSLVGEIESLLINVYI